ncbi:TetR/AcrR family transcriptional regulator [Nocardia africana]|uniref:Transcriptional regulator BetI n=1 Tax=Nocardia africana TaxID=134964 RepID=A0A378WWT6_9NOCA|nr:TetR/AcrR family transcriptional regulator [Nocardia africana]MCC3313732.1 TetR/AcrR family transcriptional regulator [Nocardia africana]SUA44884.1 transcriptional regulator BetI [Nocardia africana]
MTSGRVDGRSLRFQHRRGELIDAIMDYVLEHGIADLSFRPLADAVGVSHVTLRHHFGTKEELVAEIFETIRAREPVTSDVDGDAEALLRSLWNRWTQPEGARHFRLLFEAYGQALMHPDRYGRFLDSVVSDWISLITTLAVRAGCPTDHAETFATALLAQLRGLQLDLLATGEHARVEAALDLVIAGARAQFDSWDH